MNGRMAATIKNPGKLEFAMPGLPSHLRARSCKPGCLDTLSLCHSTETSSKFKIKSVLNSLDNGLEVRIRYLWSYILTEACFYAVKAFPAYRTNQIAFGVLRLPHGVKVVFRQSDDVIYIKFRWRRRQGNYHGQSVTVGQFARDDYHRPLFAHFRFDIAAKIANKNCPSVGVPRNSRILNLSRHPFSITKPRININKCTSIIGYAPRLTMADWFSAETPKGVAGNRFRNDGWNVLPLWA